MLLYCSGPFGSHVIEKLLTAIVTAVSTADDAGYTTLETTLSAFVDTATTNLYDMITSKYGSFVGRRMLCVLCGKDVSSPPARKPGLTTGDAPSSNAGGQHQGPKRGGLVARVGAAVGNNSGKYSHSALSFPQIFQKVAATVMSDDWTGPDLTTVQSDPYAGPFLQALLRAAVALEDEALCGRLVIHLLGGNAASGPDTVTSDSLHRLLTDRNGSHLMEAAFEAAPDDVLQKLCTAAFKGKLLSLAQHPSANFAVQAALASVRRPQQLKRMFEDLRPHLATLLRSRRGGVVTVLLAAALRVGCLESDIADALWHSVDSGLDVSAGATPLHKMLTLDTTTQLGVSGSGTRLSPLGCAALVTVLKYPGTASKKWADAIGALTPGELGTMVRDPGGCRVIETYLEGPGGAAKKRRKVLGGLQGNWAAAASTIAGCFFVEKCYDMGDATEKEAITVELAVAEDRIGVTARGASLLHRCHVDAYKKGGGDWQKRVEVAHEVRKEFEELFGDDEEEEEEETKNEDKVEGEHGDDATADEELAVEKKKEKKSKTKKEKKSKRKEREGGEEKISDEQVKEKSQKKKKKGK